MKLVDHTGRRYGKLVVIEQAGRDKLKKVLWKCKCDCGKEVTVVSGSLTTGNSTSCGCGIIKHGGTGKGSYNTWRAMIRRCTNPKDKDYPRYGGKGVAVCPEWMDYATFAKDMGEPIGDETLDRIDVYGNYGPSNCRWAGVKTQNRNTRIRPDSTSGITGVTKTGSGRYMAKISVGKNAYYSKVYLTIEEAAAARRELERKYW